MAITLKIYDKHLSGKNEEKLKRTKCVDDVLKFSSASLEMIISVLPAVYWINDILF